MACNNYLVLVYLKELWMLTLITMLWWKIRTLFSGIMFKRKNSGIRLMFEAASALCDLGQLILPLLRLNFLISTKGIIIPSALEGWVIKRKNLCASYTIHKVLNPYSIPLQVFSISFNAEEKFLSVSQFWQLIHDKMRKREMSEKSLTL